MSLREMPINHVLMLLKTRQAAIQNGDLEALNILKRKHPDLFCEEELNYFKETLYMEFIIKNSPAYKNMQKQLKRKKIFCIVNNDIKK
ncbi:MAG: hypothetical protein P4M14_10440 [Gammaproteobacteria bacterium]|nr:hypothetical protein [Gammaproteobacteria bacterium]